MRKMENTNATEKYVESKSIRNTTLDNVDYDFLDKIKELKSLLQQMLELVAFFYGKTHIMYIIGDIPL